MARSKPAPAPTLAGDDFAIPILGDDGIQLGGDNIALAGDDIRLDDDLAPDSDGDAPDFDFAAADVEGLAAAEASDILKGFQSRGEREN